MNIKLEKSLLELIERKKKKTSSKKSIKMKDIGRKAYHFFECEAFTYLRRDGADKCFFFERLRRIEVRGTKANPHTKVGDIEYRISYYIVGKNGNKKDRWTFGQFCPTISVEDFPILIEKAKSEGIIVTD
jgi:hypothetical protein